MHVQQKFHQENNQIFSYEIKTNNIVPIKAKSIFENRLNEELKKLNKLANENVQPSHIIDISFLDYNMRNAGVRFAVGIFAGTDRIDTQIIVKDKASGKIVSKFIVQSKNNSAWGTSAGLIEGHADKIVKYLTDKNNN
ncbi:DUF4410 domain-containing protein [Sulfurospirillum arcachonense]|uniref:DUF4410 domain-containing protein n=1 Tax=Sulfurospirillum arcachonense TaxID=57666 RepID=UPI00146FA677|nr:DUF4410 domain-containing protein [Sulfurospirillum arcachonense]